MINHLIRIKSSTDIFNYICTYLRKQEVFLGVEEILSQNRLLNIALEVGYKFYIKTKGDWATINIKE